MWKAHLFRMSVRTIHVKAVLSIKEVDSDVLWRTKKTRNKNIPHSCTI